MSLVSLEAYELGDKYDTYIEKLQKERDRMTILYKKEDPATRLSHSHSSSFSYGTLSTTTNSHRKLSLKRGGELAL